MARNPCDACRGRIAGKAAYLYPTVYIGDDQFGERLRLCEKCEQETLSQLGRTIDNDGRLACCVKSHEGPSGVQAEGYCYATVYTPSSDRTDFGGPVCATDLPLAAAVMRVGLPQRG